MYSNSDGRADPRTRLAVGPELGVQPPATPKPPFASSSLEKWTGLGLHSAELGDLSLLSSRIVDFLNQLPVITEAKKGQSISAAVFEGTIAGESNSPVQLVRVTHGTASDISKTLQIGAVLRELGQLEHLQSILPKVLGVSIIDRKLYLVTESPVESYPIGSRMGSRWSELSANFPDMAARFKSVFAPEVIANMQDSDLIDVANVGFDELSCDGSGKLIFNFPFDQAANYSELIRQGKIFRLDGLNHDSLLFQNSATKEVAPPRYVIRDIDDMERVSRYSDESRFSRDLSQDGIPFVARREVLGINPSGVLDKENIELVTTVEEALVLAGRRYNHEKGQFFAEKENSIGLEMAVSLCMLENQAGERIVVFRGVPGEYIEVNSYDGVDAFLGQFPGFRPILLDSIHTHELYDYHKHTPLHSVDTRAPAWNLLQDPNGDGSAVGASWKIGVAASLESIAFFIGHSHRDEPEAGFSRLDQNDAPRIGIETSPLLINGSLYPGEVPAASQVAIEQSVLLMRRLRGDPVFARRVAANLLYAATTFESRVDSFAL